MNIQDRVVIFLEQIKQLPNNKAFLEEADFLSFFVSLLPVPGVQQAGQAANKIVQDRNLYVRFTELRDSILATNERIDTLESELDRIGEIVKTVGAVSNIQRAVEDFVAMVAAELNATGSEFLVDTSHYSSQTILNQLVEVDWAAISARGHSHNVLHNTRIRARRTHLVAHDHSTNLIDGAEFPGHDGSVEMRSLSQQGNISVSGSSVGFGEGGTLGFGEGGALLFGPPETISGRCPMCSFEIRIERHMLQGKTHIQCPKCLRILPFARP
jgi:hypothetical protein